MGKIPPNSLSQSSSQNAADRAIGRKYAAIALGAYALAEALIFAGVQPGFLDHYIAYGGITSYGLPLERERNLVIHLGIQTLALPAYVVVNHEGIGNAIRAGRKMGIKAFVGGPFLTSLFILLLYTPAQSQTNPYFHRYNVLHFLINQANLAYSLVIGLCVAMIGLGLQVPAIQIARFFRSK